MVLRSAIFLLFATALAFSACSKADDDGAGPALGSVRSSTTGPAASDPARPDRATTVIGSAPTELTTAPATVTSKDPEVRACLRRRASGASTGQAVVDECVHAVQWASPIVAALIGPGASAGTSECVRQEIYAMTASELDQITSSALNPAAEGRQAATRRLRNIKEKCT